MLLVFFFLRCPVWDVCPGFSVWTHLSSLNGRENPTGGVVSCTWCDLMPVLTWNLKCVCLVLQGIDLSPARSIASVLTAPAPYFNGFNPPNLAKNTDRSCLRSDSVSFLSGEEVRKLVRCFLIGRQISISYWLPDLFLFSDIFFFCLHQPRKPKPQNALFLSGIDKAWCNFPTPLNKALQYCVCAWLAWDAWFPLCLWHLKLIWGPHDIWNKVFASSPKKL